MVLGPGPAHDLLRREVAQWVGCAVTDVVLGHRCRHCGGDDHGRPLVLAPAGDLQVSLSRTTGLVAVALSEAGPVGVDVETAGAAAFDGFDDVVLHGSERLRPGEPARTAVQNTRIWVRKEAALKALGSGLRTDPRDLSVSPADAGRGFWSADLDAGPDHQGAVAVLAADAVSLTLVRL